MSSILLVEDDYQIGELYRDFFIDKGYGVFWAKNGKEGLIHAFENRPDIIILDLVMPTMDGMSVLSELRGDRWGSKVPVIVMTNLNPSEAMMNKFTEYVPIQVLLKVDVSPEDVLMKVREMLGAANKT